MKTSTSEKGHAKNIANFKVLINNCIGIGAAYNPTNPLIAIEVLQVISDNATTDQQNVNNLEPAYKNAVANREELFSPLNKLITKIRKAYKATQGVNKTEVDNFMTIARKIKGDRKAEKKQIDEATTEENKYSISQLSYDQRTNNFDALVALLENNTDYNPNEDIFKSDTLRTMHQKMLIVTDEVSQKFIPFNSARSRRNNRLYYESNNLVDTAYTVKDYLASILEVNSSEYKAIAKIKFSRI